MGFAFGDRVEVCSNEEGFVGSQYYGRIVGDFYGGEAYGVQYKNLLKDDMSGPLTEIVSAAEIRPAPPKVPLTGCFVVNDRVDAFANDGWWSGIVTGARRSKSSGECWYRVFFESSGDEITYPASRVRVHLDWIHGKWIIAQCKNRSWVS